MTRREKDLREFLSLLMLVLLIAAGIALTMLGCGSADGPTPSPSGEASPEPQHESSDVCAPAPGFIAWELNGLVHVSKRLDVRTAVTQHYDRTPPFFDVFEESPVFVGEDLSVCLL